MRHAVLIGLDGFSRFIRVSEPAPSVWLVPVQRPWKVSLSEAIPEQVLGTRQFQLQQEQDPASGYLVYHER